MDGFRAAFQHHAQAAHVGEFLHQDGVAGVDERVQDDADRTAGSVGNEYVIRRRVKASIGGQPLRHEFPQTVVTGGRRVGGQRFGAAGFKAGANRVQVFPGADYLGNGVGDGKDVLNWITTSFRHRHRAGKVVGEQGCVIDH